MVLQAMLILSYCGDEHDKAICNGLPAHVMCLLAFTMPEPF
jgi:hypothetical protein